MTTHGRDLDEILSLIRYANHRPDLEAFSLTELPCGFFLLENTSARMPDNAGNQEGADMNILRQHANNFGALQQAFERGLASLVECRDIRTGEAVATICRVDAGSTGEVELIPFAYMINGNPYEAVAPPSEDGTFHDVLGNAEQVTAQRIEAYERYILTFALPDEAPTEERAVRLLCAALPGEKEDTFIVRVVGNSTDGKQVEDLVHVRKKYAATTPDRFAEVLSDLGAEFQALVTFRYLPELDEYYILITRHGLEHEQLQQLETKLTGRVLSILVRSLKNAVQSPQ